MSPSRPLRQHRLIWSECGSRSTRGDRRRFVASFTAEPTAEFVAEASSNVELVSRLLDNLRAGLDHAVPGAVVLPPGACEDRLRWIGTWPRLGPQESLAMLGLDAGAEGRDVLTVVYERYADHWAANVAYHF